MKRPGSTQSLLAEFLAPESVEVHRFCGALEATASSSSCEDDDSNKPVSDYYDWCLEQGPRTRRCALQMINADGPLSRPAAANEGAKARFMTPFPYNLPPWHKKMRFEGIWTQKRSTNDVFSCESSGDSESSADAASSSTPNARRRRTGTSSPGGRRLAMHQCPHPHCPKKYSKSSHLKVS